MAQRPVEIGRFTLVGAAMAVLVLGVLATTLAALFWRADRAATLGPGDWATIRFTLVQALTSAALSVLLAIPVARALARRRFAGRGVLITLLGAPFILPVIVAILGLLAVFGRNGLLNAALGSWGPVSIFGLQGVVLANVFFNLPLATRLILQGWQAIPGEHFRLAAALGFRVGDINRWLERPMLRAVVPGAFLVIFGLCLTSFAVALTLGGGPAATTVELAIYQAFTFEFNLGRAAILALVQFGLTGIAAIAVFRFGPPNLSQAGFDRPQLRWDTRHWPLRMADALWVGVAAIFLLLPLSMVIFTGTETVFRLPASIYLAALRSIMVALASTAVTVLLAVLIAHAAARLRHRAAAGMIEAAGVLAIAASPLVIGTGLFILIFPLVDPARLALPVTAGVNAIMSLPFALRALIPAMRDAERDFGRLADSLGLTGLTRLRVVFLARLQRPLGFSAGLAAALSMGDLGVITLFSATDQATLPLQMYRLMGAYRMDLAAGAALLLLALSLGLFWLFDRGGRMNADI